MIQNDNYLYYCSIILLLCVESKDCRTSKQKQRTVVERLFYILDIFNCHYLQIIWCTNTHYGNSIVNIVQCFHNYNFLKWLEKQLTDSYIIMQTRQTLSFSKIFHYETQSLSSKSVHILKDTRLRDSNWGNVYLSACWRLPVSQCV